MGLSLKKPSRERSEKRAKDAAEKLGEGEKRIVADVPERIHRQVRVKCLQRGVLVRDYILELLAKGEGRDQVVRARPFASMRTHVPGGY